MSMEVLRNMVRENVYVCQTSLVESLLSNYYFDDDSIKNMYIDNSKAIDELEDKIIELNKAIDEVEEIEYTISQALEEDKKALEEDLKNYDSVEELKEKIEKLEDEIEELESENGDIKNEPLEYWVVSNWFAERLEEHGELTVSDGECTWWGRCTSGQAIYLDSIIEEIYDEI